MAKAVKKTVYQASDGTEFLTEAEAESHEAKIRLKTPEVIVAGKSAKELKDAVDGGDKYLADAIEILARHVREARLARGERKTAGRPTGSTAEGEGEAEKTAEAA